MSAGVCGMSVYAYPLAQSHGRDFQQKQDDDERHGLLSKGGVTYDLPYVEPGEHNEPETTGATSL